jgi:hypothetical protein
MAMIAAYREIGKMLGFYCQPMTPVAQGHNDELLRAMSDEELKALT